MNLEYLYDRARRRAPASFDFDTVVADSKARNAELISDWRTRFPGTDSAVLETVIQAAGHARRRLRRYSEFSDAHRGTPGVLIIRELTAFDAILDFKIVEYRAAAARADIDEIEWRFLSVAEALEPPKP